KRLYGSPDPQTLRAMEDYEIDTPKRLEKALKILAQVQTYLRRASAEMRDQQIKGIRPVNKGLRAAKQLHDVSRTVLDSLKSRDGSVMKFGVPSVIVVEGYEKKDGTPGLRVKTVPLDV